MSREPHASSTAMEATASVPLFVMPAKAGIHARFHGNGG
jgi:hypothetical protein